MASVRYHVIHSMEQWLAIECHCTEAVVLSEPNIPRFDFNIKIFASLKRRDLFIPGCAIAGLKVIKNYIQTNNIAYKPTNHIKFAFEYIDSAHCFKQSESPKSKRQYPQPMDLHVAQAVATQLFETNDMLGGEDEDKVVYYYLSVLRAVNHPVINHARSLVNYCPADQNLFDSALIPRCDRKCSQVRYYSWYADLIYFLGLMAPPIEAGDTVARITEKVRIRHQKQLTMLCDAIGITNCEPIVRGEGWQKLTRFLDASPIICRVIAASILKPPELETSLTVIEDQVVRQLKQLWQWTGLYNFRDSYEFACLPTTEAHTIPAVAKQSKQVKYLFTKLREAVCEENLIPYAKLLVDDVQFFEQYHENNYPDLFYAAKSYMVNPKEGNAAWEEFVATRPVTIPRHEIDEKLWIPRQDDEWEEPDPQHFDFDDGVAWKPDVQTENIAGLETESNANGEEAEDNDAESSVMGIRELSIQALGRVFESDDSDWERDANSTDKSSTNSKEFEFVA